MKKEKIYVIWCDGNSSGCREYPTMKDAIEDTFYSQHAEVIIKGNELDDKQYDSFWKKVKKLAIEADKQQAKKRASFNMWDYWYDNFNGRER